MDRSPCRPLAQVDQILARPNHFKHEVNSPDGLVEQGFHWTHHGCEWSLLLPVLEKASASVLLRRTYDFSTKRDQRWLTFELRPATMAEHLTVGLLDDPKSLEGAHLARPLSEFAVGHQGDWGYYRIPLDSFRDSDVRSVNWATIRGLQISRVGSAGPKADMLVKRMHFQSRAYDVPHQYASLAR